MGCVMHLGSTGVPVDIDGDMMEQEGSADFAQSCGGCQADTSVWVLVSATMSQASELLGTALP